jgi:ATP-dependent DNA helicase RecQ
VINVLRGSDARQISTWGHDKLATYGTGADKSLAEWRGVVRQLIHRGFLLQDVTAYNVLKLTPLTKPILREGARLELAKPRALEPKERKSRSRTWGAAASAGNVDSSLFEALRRLRRKLADEQKVPPYVIFGDVTLQGMAAKKPRTRDDLLEVSGVGQRKLERYGQDFLDEIRKHT